MKKIKDTLDMEHEAWLDMFKLMAKTFNLTKKELNKEEYKPLFIAIERWAYFDRERRKANPEADKWKGLFYNDEKD